MWNVRIVRQCGILTVPTIWNVFTVTTVWYFNCPRQCEVFLLFRQCGMLTVPNNVECSYCSDSVVFNCSRSMECSYCSYSVVF